MFRAIIYCDGGCKGNPGPMYGSHCTDIYDTKIHSDDPIYSCIERLTFGEGTNNRAEYMTAIRAVSHLRTVQISQERLTLKDYELILHVDSQLIERQLSGKYQVRDSVIGPLFTDLSHILSEFHSFKIIWVPREVMVDILGH